MNQRYPLRAILLDSLRRARPAFNLLPVSNSPLLRFPFSSLRSVHLYPPTPNFNRTCLQLPRRAFSRILGSPDDFFDYSSGRWL